ncbi:glutathione S-transferase [Planktomarina temperata]|nr:glutathione S-transferase [Planktomarina temperata]
MLRLIADKKFHKKGHTMIDLYTWTTPNGRKVSILLEELGVSYTPHTIDISKDEQFAPDFLKIAPNNRIPAIVDQETGTQLMETGAIMLYLADKYKKFQCAGDEYWRMVEWLMWQMGGLGPMLGQTHHFVKYNKGKSEYSEKRYAAEAQRLYGVLNRRLEGRNYIAGTAPECIP